MANITISIQDDVRRQMENYDEVRWSEVAKKAILQKVYELRKLDILRKYVDREPFSTDDLAWMEENDWHPVDEKPMKKEFVEKIRSEMGRPGRRMTLKELLR